MTFVLSPGSLQDSTQSVVLTPTLRPCMLEGYLARELPPHHAYGSRVSLVVEYPASSFDLLIAVSDITDSNFNLIQNQ